MEGPWRFGGGLQEAPEGGHDMRGRTPLPGSVVRAVAVCISLVSAEAAVTIDTVAYGLHNTSMWSSTGHVHSRTGTSFVLARSYVPGKQRKGASQWLSILV